MRNNRFPLYIGLTFVSILFMLMLVSLFYTPYDPNAIDPTNRLSSPSAAHLFGTDNFGRDIFSRVMEGTKTAFFIGTIAVSIGLLFGFLLGACAGYFGSWIDELTMRFIDAMLAFPGILLAIMLIAVFEPGMKNTVIALGVMSVPTFARIIRSTFIQYKSYDFVKASIAKGGNAVHIMMKHILPNALSPILVAASLSFSGSVLAESGLSYLGLGVQPPDPSWGRMLKEAQPYIASAPWYVIIVGVVITVLVLGFNLLSDGLRDIHDKRA